METLNDDILIYLFQFCSEWDRDNLHKVCRKFHHIVEFYFYKEKCRNLLITSFDKDLEHRNRLHGNLDFSDRLKLYENWFNGSYSKTVYLQHKENFHSHIQLDAYHLYASNLGELRIYQRSLNDLKLTEKIGNPNSSEINNLVMKDEVLLGSKKNGKIFTYTGESGYSEEIFSAPNDQIVDLDYRDKMAVVTSDRETRILEFSEEFGIVTLSPVKYLQEKFLNTKFSPEGDRILGVRMNEENLMFSLVDIESSKIVDSKFGCYSSINSVESKWMNPATFLFNMDPHFLSVIDIRVWPLLSTTKLFHHYRLTCYDFDGKFGVICGTNIGLLVLIDIRKPNDCVRLYDLEAKHTEFMAGGCSHAREIVCKEIVFDERHLFLSTNHDISLLNFCL